MKTKFSLKIITVIASLTFSSCLKKDLPVLPLYDTNDIATVSLEHRYLSSTKTMNGQPVVSYKKLNAALVIDKPSHTITVTPGIPSASGDFTTEERAKVNINALTPYFTISTAATMQGINGTPNPGNVTDCSKPLVYQVTAANGSQQTWTINVNPFP